MSATDGGPAREPNTAIILRQDFGNYLQSFPDYFSLGPNIQYFAEHGVRGLFEEGPGISVGDGTDMEELKDYVRRATLLGAH